MINYKLVVKMIKQYSKDMSIDSIDINEEALLDNPMIQDLEINGGFDRYQIDTIINTIASEDVDGKDLKDLDYKFIAFYLGKHHDEYEVHDVSSLMTAIRNDRICKDYEEEINSDDINYILKEFYNL